MLRRSLITLSSNVKNRAMATTRASSSKARTIVRDPRKAKKKKTSLTVVDQHEQGQLQQNQQQSQRPVMPFEPSQQNQQSVGSTLGSYMLMGAGMSFGIILVRSIIG